MRGSGGGKGRVNRWKASGKPQSKRRIEGKPTSRWDVFLSRLSERADDGEVGMPVLAVTRFASRWTYLVFKSVAHFTWHVWEIGTNYLHFVRVRFRVVPLFRLNPRLFGK